MTFSKKPDVATAQSTGEANAPFLVAMGPTAAMEFWGRIANETAHFAADRLCETVKTQQQMMQCRTLSEVAHLRSLWWQTAINQYADESRRLSDICRETLGRTVQIRAA